MVEKEKVDSLQITEDNRGNLDDDGRPKRTGTTWTASAHIITAVIGSGVLSLGWAMAQLGWVAGTFSLLIFAFVTYYTSSLLTDCYRTDDPVNGKRNYTYMESVRSNLDETQYWICGLNQYVNLFGTAVGYTITASGSAVAISKANCYHNKGHEADCMFLETYYMVGFGVIEIILSQLPNFHELWWLSIVASSMSFIYSFIAIGLSIAKIASGDVGHTTITGVVVGVDVSQADKVWGVLLALGNIAFAYSYSMILIEIQDTLKSPPAENKQMKKATLVGVSTTTVFYMMCGCLGYAAFGNNAPGNMLTGFGFYEPFWLINIANMCIFIHLVGAYQVYSQPLYAAFENYLAEKYPDVKFFSDEYTVINTKCFKLSLNNFRLIWRTAFVIVSTVLAIAIPFFNDVLGLLGAVGFWPLTVYFPVEMYIKQKKIKKFSRQWILMETLSMLCLIVSVAATVGAVEGVVVSLKNSHPFQNKV